MPFGHGLTDMYHCMICISLSCSCLVFALFVYTSNMRDWVECLITNKSEQWHLYRNGGVLSPFCYIVN